jgi:MFS superfamily sulfate permease-like transporter
VPADPNILLFLVYFIRDRLIFPPLLIYICVARNHVLYDSGKNDGAFGEEGFGIDLSPQYDFVSGVIFGLVLASVFFVIQNSRRHSIRNNFSVSFAIRGTLPISEYSLLGCGCLVPGEATQCPSKISSRAWNPNTDHLPSRFEYRSFCSNKNVLTRALFRICFLWLAAFLGELCISIFISPLPFIGTISEVEDTCRAFLDKSAWEENPIRFLIVDLALVGGLDLSAAEAFVRVQRLLVAKRVILVFCGQPLNSDVAKALQAVDLWSGNAEVFATLNEVSHPWCTS